MKVKYAFTVLGCILVFFFSSLVIGDELINLGHPAERVELSEPPAVADASPYPAMVPKTGQTTSYSAGGDGARRKGVPWPAPRFTDNGDGTATDKLTGLIWIKNAGCFTGRKTWTEALAAANGLASGSCGLSDNSIAGDWRLPNVIELDSLNDYSKTVPSLPSGHPFTGVYSDNYWSSTTCGYDTSQAWFVNLYESGVFFRIKTDSLWVWPVRGGQSGSSSSSIMLRKTGQTTSYGSRDDGALQYGVAWPTPRFADNANGTVTDKLTGLIWLKNANCFSRLDWDGALSAANSLAKGSCGLTDGSQAGDWRLLNVTEIKSLIDYSKSTMLLPSGHPFTGVMSSLYWLSSTLAIDSTLAWLVFLDNGHVDFNYKTLSSGCVWPVRGGQSGSLDPLIISFTPTSGHNGTTVTITGMNFTGTSSVTFGGTPANTFHVDSATQITAVVGSGATGAIRVTTSKGSYLSGGNFILNPYMVTFTAGSGGTISGTTPQTVTAGGNTSAVTAVSNTGYHFTNWSGDYIGTTNPLTLTNVTTDMSITANFAINQNTVNFIAGTHGSITGAASQNVSYGGNCTQVTAIPATGY
ncbi:MAG: DUF1566 domain-containing protein, partial [Deltaproteobacteria bacterium]|nr:DUF1566 domain-containing protein [Deltaproteobacteria bacterium]